jgi:hypothetical protein
MLNKQSIIEAEDRPITEVDCPEWGGTVGIRAMSGSDMAEYQGVLAEGVGEGNMDYPQLILLLLSMSIVDSEGARMFSRSDIKCLGDKSGQCLMRVFKAAASLNNLDEDLAGNSCGTPDDASSGE